MKRILITGSEGQLGKTFQKISTSTQLGYDFIFTDLPELDITNIESIRAICLDRSIDILINCAAYTAVDKAEEDQENAHLINCIGVSHLAKVCNELGIFMIHISTDYVFDGEGIEPYDEGSAPNPISVYGASKLSGETEMARTGVHGVILRTSWLYSEFGNNFVFTILRIAREREKIQIVDDQFGTPTNSTDLAEAILKIISRHTDFVGCELYHYSNGGSCSWHEFAKRIVEIKGISFQVDGIKSEEYKTKAKRPKHSVLNKEKIIKKLKIEIPEWEESLKKMLINID